VQRDLQACWRRRNATSRRVDYGCRPDLKLRLRRGAGIAFGEVDPPYAISGDLRLRQGYGGRAGPLAIDLRLRLRRFAGMAFGETDPTDPSLRKKDPIQLRRGVRF